MTFRSGCIKWELAAAKYFVRAVAVEGLALVQGEEPYVTMHDRIVAGQLVSTSDWTPCALQHGRLIPSQEHVYAQTQVIFFDTYRVLARPIA